MMNHFTDMFAGIFSLEYRTSEDGWTFFALHRHFPILNRGCENWLVIQKGCSKRKRLRTTGLELLASNRPYALLNRR